MSRKRNWLKFRLHGARSAIDEGRMSDLVSLPARQALEAAASGLAAALLRWDIPFLTNGEKSWREIIMEISRRPEVLWHYVTALRGPDPVTCACTAKAIFTCPLRGRCVYALGKEEFLERSAGEVETGFVTVYKYRNELYHYLQHIVAVWEVFYPPLGELLANTFLKGGCLKPEEAAQRYMELLEKWMRGKHVIMKEESNEEPR